MIVNKYLFLTPLALALPFVAQAKGERPPNIVLILVDDLGYGDVAGLNPQSKIATPNIDRMIDAGVSFTDAHTSSSVSTPTRYSLLTGRYNWRTSLKAGVLNGFSAPLITPQRSTMASVLKRANYNTACIGKWHLGWNWNNIEQGEQNVDFSKPISGGPTELGFDYFYGFNGSLDMPPYVYVENNMTTAPPDRVTSNTTEMGFWRKGVIASDFDHNTTLPHIVDKGVQFIKEASSKKEPFFLYLPLPAPHTPILPQRPFLNASGLNEYGDFVMMVDSEVGRVLKAIESAGVSQNTIVVFTSDNGCSPRAKYDELMAKGHNPSYIYRGTKADLYEGGHRVPCVVNWGNVLKAGTLSHTVCLTDFFATFANIAGVKLSDSEGEDSYSLLPLIDNTQRKKGVRDAVIHHSVRGHFAIRKGDWKLLATNSSGGWSYPRPSDKAVLAGLPAMQLYNIADDPSEKNNLYERYPQRVNELLNLLIVQINDGRSTPGKPQKNDPINGEWEQLNMLKTTNKYE